jgi:Ca2+-transporting ATPase
MSSQPVYSLNKSEVFIALETSPEGLSPFEVQRRIELYGENIITEPEQSPVWRMWLATLIHPSALLLWLAGAITLVTGNPELAVVIWLVVIINATFSFYREYWAERSVTGLKNFLPSITRITREGQDISVPVSNVVPGDILVLAEGDRIPADARVIEEFGLRVNNSTLTGEAMPARKTVDASFREGLTDLERPNLIFAGTTVFSGTGKAVVYSTGMLTQFGRIAGLTQSLPDIPGGVQQEMARLSRVLSFVALVIGVIVLLVASTDVGLPPGEAIVLAIGIVVAVIPEGLSPTVTMSLAVGVQRLAQKGVLVKKLSTLETIGNISVLCTDKSGTLTQNQMTVCNLWVAGNRYKVTGVGYDPKGQITPEVHNSSLSAKNDLNNFLTAAKQCNNARLLPPDSIQPIWTALGDQTEAALLALFKKRNLLEEENLLPRVHEIPFDARRKRMSTIHRDLDGQEIAYIKGSPKEILQLCTHILINETKVQLTNDLRNEVIGENDRYARQSLRVLALATKELETNLGSYAADVVENDLTFLGLAAMMDPPRPEVERAIGSFRRAGIRMVMITGDYGLTAESMARRIGMIAGSPPRILTGADLDSMDDDHLLELLKEESIFARMAPEHKVRLVAAFQKKGEVVALVGDGVNDAPALRKADIGIAMGVTGTDVAREAADIVLTQDNFELIIRGIEEGRAIYDNLRKFMTYIFASNVPEVLPFILTAIFNLPLAITVLQILLIDLVTDLLPALALGMEKPEPDILNRPPRKRGKQILDKALIIRAFAWLGSLEALLCYAGFFMVYFMNSQPYSIITAPSNQLSSLFSSDQNLILLSGTVYFAGVIIAQVGNALACRSEKGNVRWLGIFSNRSLLIGIAIQILLLFGMIYIKPVAQFLNLTPLPTKYWIWIMLYAPILYFIERFRKTVFRRVNKMKLGGAS